VYVRSFVLSLHINTSPDVWFGFNTNLLGNSPKSISSNLSHTPNKGIRYSSPIVCDINSRTL